MKYLLKIFIFSSLLLCAKHLRAQVTGVQYAILFNSNTNLFDCYIYVSEGEAITVRNRVQFNSQFSIVIPTGARVKMESSNMPLTDNQKFLGTHPMKWTITSKLLSPEIYPEVDFYGITPNLAPVGFYNKLIKGDLVKIFSLSIEKENIDYNQVRLFDNESDPNSNVIGMQNSDFSNGFTIGGYKQIFEGIKYINQEESNYNSLVNEK